MWKEVKKSGKRTDIRYNHILSDSGHGFNRIRARCCMCVLARPIRAVKAVFFNIKVNALLFWLSKSYFHDLHFHPVVTDPCEKPEKAANRRVSQIVVTQHIAATCDLQTAVPRADFLGGIRNRKICPHILDFAVLSHVFAIIFTAVRLAASKTRTPSGKASAIPRTSSRTCWVRK